MVICAKPVGMGEAQIKLGKCNKERRDEKKTNNITYSIRERGCFNMYENAIACVLRIVHWHCMCIGACETTMYRQYYSLSLGKGYIFPLWNFVVVVIVKV